MVEKEKDQQYGIDIVSAFAERTVKRLWITIILLVILLFGSNAAWIYYESQFQDESWTYETEQDTDNGGSNYYYGGDYYGAPESESNSQETNP